jgi:hypothetical protein
MNSKSQIKKIVRVGGGKIRGYILEDSEEKVLVDNI